MLQPTLFPLTVPSPITLYPYQQACVDATLDGYLIHNRRKVVIELPTRSGKTLIAYEIIRRLRQLAPRTRSLFLVPSISLAHQAARDAQMFFSDRDIGLVQAEHNQVGRPITIATVQTLADPYRRAALLRAQRWERFSVVIIDECHYATASSYTEVLKDLERPDGLRLGASATPYRGDGQSLLIPFPDGLIYSIDIMELIAQGYLLPIEAHKLDTDLDLSHLKVEGILEAESEEETRNLPQRVIERMQTSNRYAVALQAWQEIMGEDRTLIFANDVKDIYGFYEYFSRHGVSCAPITSKTTQDERDILFEHIHAGTLRVLIGFGVFTTGLTIKRIKGAIVGRLSWMRPWPHKSMGIHQQSIGRIIGPSDEMDKHGNPLKVVGKVAYLTTSEYHAIPPIMSMGCLPGDLCSTGGKREVFLKQVDEDLGVESTQEERETYTPLQISLKLKKLHDEIVDIFAGDGWEYSDNAFRRTCSAGTLIATQEDAGLYNLSLESHGKILPIPLHREQRSEERKDTVRSILAEASHYLVRQGFAQSNEKQKQREERQRIAQDEQESLLRYLKNQRRLFLPHGLLGMTYGHYHQIQNLLKTHGDAFPTINGVKQQLCYDQGSVYFRPLPVKKGGSAPKKKGETHHAKD